MCVSKYFVEMFIQISLNSTRNIQLTPPTLGLVTYTTPKYIRHHSVFINRILQSIVCPCIKD